MPLTRPLSVSRPALLPLRQPPVQAGHDMNRPFRTAAIMTLWATYGALWVVVVMMGRPPTTSQGTLRWPLSLAATLFLMGTLFVVGLLMASPARARGVRSQRQVPRRATVVAALVTVGALLGLVASLRTVVFGGPALAQVGDREARCRRSGDWQRSRHGLGRFGGPHLERVRPVGRAWPGPDPESGPDSDGFAGRHDSGRSGRDAGGTVQRAKELVANEG